MAKLLTVGALCEEVEYQAMFDLEGFVEGAKVALGGKVLSFGASGDDRDSICRFAYSFVVSGEPSWLFC
jgi:hypothetical protein